MTGNEVLRAALIQSAEEYFSRYETAETEKNHRFSLAFYIRKISVERLARKAEKIPPRDLPQRRYMPLKRLAVIIALIFAAVFLTAAAWVAYIAVRGFVFEVHTTHSDVSVDFSMYAIKDTIEETYRLPTESGCVFIDEITDSEAIISEYEYGDGNVTLVQSAKGFSENMMINTENAEVYEVSVKDGSGFVLIRRKGNGENITSITWVSNEYLFDIVGVSLEKEELIELAESVVTEKADN